MKDTRSKDVLTLVLCISDRNMNSMLAEVQQVEHKRKIFFFQAFLEAILIHISKGNLDSFTLNILSPSTAEIKEFQSSFDKTI